MDNPTPRGELVAKPEFLQTSLAIPSATQLSMGISERPLNRCQFIGVTQVYVVGRINEENVELLTCWAPTIAAWPSARGQLSG